MTAPVKPSSALLASRLVQSAGPVRLDPPAVRWRNRGTGINRAVRDYAYDREAAGRARRASEFADRVREGVVFDDGRALEDEANP